MKIENLQRRIYVELDYYKYNLERFDDKRLESILKRLINIEIDYRLLPRVWIELVHLKKLVRDELDKDINEFIKENF